MNIQKLKMDQPTISAIVRTFNEARWIGETLSALRGQNYPIPIEIIVVDSGSTDNTLEIAAPLADRIVNLSPGTFTFGRALNRGAETATGELLLNLSADATPIDTDYLRSLIAPLEAPEVVATFGRDCPRPDASPSQARDAETWFPATRSLDPARRYSNANACIRRSIWEQFPFNEILKGAEDLEWARRVLTAGHRIVYVPEAMVSHSHPPSPRDVYARAFRQRRTLCSLDPVERGFSPGHALRFWLGISTLDFIYALRHHYAIQWFFHIPLYRAAQAWGLYQGARSC
jgi:rhamnosyltransferase